MTSTAPSPPSITPPKASPPTSTPVPTVSLAPLGLAGDHGWPLWMDAAGFGKLKALVDFSANAAYGDATVAKLKGGPLLREMLERMETKAACLAETGPKCGGLSDLAFYGYSADPLLLHGLLRALGVVSGGLPGNAAALALELWENPGNALEVRALYYDGQTGLGGSPKLREVPIGGCPELNCTLAAFRSRSSDFLPGNLEQECGILTKGKGKGSQLAKGRSGKGATVGRAGGGVRE